MNRIREKQHRHPLECYRGEVIVAFTACMLHMNQFFLSNDVVDPMVDFFLQTLPKNNCISPVYCFMPDHLHIIIQGQSEESDTWRAMVDFKQKSGYWLRMNHLQVKWQKDFYDHIIRKSEDLGFHIRYILENPIRKGLVEEWWKYLFLGAIRCDLNEVVESLVCF